MQIEQRSDPELLWLWHRLVATAPIRPLAWEPPYAMGATLEKTKRQKDKKKKKKRLNFFSHTDPKIRYVTFSKHVFIMS